MDRDEFLKLVEAVKVLPLRPDDVIVFRVSAFIDSDTSDRIKRHIVDSLGLPNKVLVLSGGAQLEIIRPEA